ncbi:MAG TPA: MscL family protein [Candidatus Saccharimonadales bacterium]|nr:MscL family protein [Candidatus Saccharimonadales bacterium]
MSDQAKPLSEKSEAELKREAKARLNRLDPVAATELVNEVVGKGVRDSVNGFLNFLREYGVLGLAVGFVLGSQVQAVVKQIIASFIDPLFALIFPGETTLSARTFTLHFDGRHANFGWGAVMYDLIDFLFIAATVYVIIKLLQLDRLKPQQKK